MKINLGCGTIPREGYINIDKEPWPGVDIVRDVLRGLPFSDDSVEQIYSENFLEHIPQTEVIWMMNEMHRVLLKNGGKALHLVPQFGTPVDVGDPTHLSRWSVDTFTYFEWSHGHNNYYRGIIKPWVIHITIVEPNKLIEVEMIPYHAAEPTTE